MHGTELTSGAAAGARPGALAEIGPGVVCQRQRASVPRSWPAGEAVNATSRILGSVVSSM